MQTREQYISATVTTLIATRTPHPGRVSNVSEIYQDFETLFKLACAMADLLEKKLVAPWLQPVATPSTPLVVAFEYGYLQCEKGHNIQKALANFAAHFTTSHKPCQHSWAHPGTSKNPTHCVKCGEAWQSLETAFKQG